MNDLVCWNRWRKSTDFSMVFKGTLNDVLFSSRSRWSFSLEVKNYVLASPLNEVHLDLYEASNEWDEQRPSMCFGSSSSRATTFDLHAVDSPMLVEGDQEIVPWIPLTPTLLLPFHLEFERIPLTFCPRHKREKPPLPSLWSPFCPFQGVMTLNWRFLRVDSLELLPSSALKRKRNESDWKRKKRSRERRRRRRIDFFSFQMDDYSTKIKNEAEHLIQTEFPEKALELDTLVSVSFPSSSIRHS